MQVWIEYIAVTSRHLRFLSDSCSFVQRVL